MSRYLYGRNNSGTEINLREEFNNFLDGKFPEISKKQVGILRKMNRPLIECACVDPNTHEPDKDKFCIYCQGEKYIWTESFIDIYRVIIAGEVSNAVNENLLSLGTINEPLTLFYVKSIVDITKEDKLIELVLDTDGNPVRPYQRKAIYRIGIPIDFRADNGKLEYWKLACFSEYRKFLNGYGG